MSLDDAFPDIPDDLSELADLGAFEVPDDLSGLGGLGDETSEPEFEIPDDISALTKPTHRLAAFLLTPIADAQALAATCALVEVDAQVVSSPTGAIAVLAVLDGDAPEKAAVAVSAAARGVPVVLASRGAEQVSATRYVDGQAIGETPLALLLANATDEVEDLLLGQITIDHFVDALATNNITRMKALRMLAASTSRHLKRGGRKGKKATDDH